MSNLLLPPANSREEFHDTLVECMDEDDRGHVYFQPGDEITMEYPAIVYSRDFDDKQFADNRPYHAQWRYQVTVMDYDPDSPIVERVRQLPQSSFIRSYGRQQLNHDVFSVSY